MYHRLRNGRNREVRTEVPCGIKVGAECSPLFLELNALI